MSCPDCVSGSIHDGTHKGSEIKVAGIDAYTVGAEDSKQIIFIGTDVFGWKLVNTRLLADEYAAKGFRVVVPDLFNGSSLPTFTLTALDTNYPRSFFTRSVMVPFSFSFLIPFVLRNIGHQISRITSVAEALRAAHPDAKIGFVGFCWGGRFAFTLNPLFDATVACHPSLVKFPAELENITRPFSLAAGATDPLYNRERALETEKLLKQRGVKDAQVVVYETVGHGWAVRADLRDEKQKKARDETVAQVVGWFEKHLSGDLAPDQSPPY